MGIEKLKQNIPRHRVYGLVFPKTRQRIDTITEQKIVFPMPIHFASTPPTIFPKQVEREIRAKIPFVTEKSRIGIFPTKDRMATAPESIKRNKKLFFLEIDIDFCFKHGFSSADKKNTKEHINKIAYKKFSKSKEKKLCPSISPIAPVETNTPKEMISLFVCIVISFPPQIWNTAFPIPKKMADSMLWNFTRKPRLKARIETSRNSLG